MAKLQFNETDAELLYCFPQPPADLFTIVWYFTFVNRAAPPTFVEVASCLTKAMEAGIVREDSGRYVIVEEWYEPIHREDATAGNEIYSMMAFEEGFVDVEFEPIAEVGAIPSEAEYAAVLRRLR